MIIYQLLYLMPALIVVAVGFQVRSRWPGESRERRWRQFLAIALAVQLFLMLVLTPTSLNFILGPAVTGTSAALLLLVNWDLRTWTAGSIKTAAPYVALIAVLLILLEIQSRISLFLVLPTVVVPLVWRAYDWRGPWRWLAFLVLLALLAYALDAIPSAFLSMIPVQAETVISTLAGLWGMIVIVLLARLTCSTRWPESLSDWLAVGWRVIIAALLLFSVAYQIVSSLAWDLMTDGLGAVMMIELIGWAAVAAAMLWAWKSTEWGRGTMSAVIFVLVILVAPQIPLLNGGMWPSPVQLTAERAAQVDRAILRYQAQHAHYPAALADLSPWYLWHVPEPIMIRDLTWCYESGENYYRLGYAFHEGFDARASVKLQGSAGMPPNPAWRCDEQVAEYNASPYRH